MKRFALTGAAGYVAPRHVKAIKEVGGDLVAALDLHDNVGYLDRWFPKARFFTSPAQFERFLLGLKEAGSPVDYVSVCTPNNMHFGNAIMGMSVGADIICEKPLVVEHSVLGSLRQAENKYNKRVWNVLQLRYHERLLELKNIIEKRALEGHTERYRVSLQYVTPRGQWYDVSWKGTLYMSGGILMNIGVHLFDLVLWLFGPMRRIAQLTLEQREASGVLELENADVTWQLSLNGKTTERYMSIYPPLFQRDEPPAWNFTGGFENLHTTVYRKILEGGGCGITDVRPSIELIRDLEAFACDGDSSLVTNGADDDEATGTKSSLHDGDAR